MKQFPTWFLESCKRYVLLYILYLLLAGKQRWSTYFLIHSHNVFGSEEIWFVETPLLHVLYPPILGSRTEFTFSTTLQRTILLKWIVYYKFALFSYSLISMQKTRHIKWNINSLNNEELLLAINNIIVKNSIYLALRTSQSGTTKWSTEAVLQTKVVIDVFLELCFI